MLSDGKDDDGTNKPLSVKTVYEAIAAAKEVKRSHFYHRAGDRIWMRRSSRRSRWSPGGQYFAAPTSADPETRQGNRCTVDRVVFAELCALIGGLSCSRQSRRGRAGADRDPAGPAHGIHRVRDDRRMDALLQKVNDRGIGSLTDGEKQFLYRMSRRKRWNRAWRSRRARGGVAAADRRLPARQLEGDDDGEGPLPARSGRTGASVHDPDVNAGVSAFARTDFSGALVRTQDAIGSKVLLLDFWSVFCQSCLLEMPFSRSCTGATPLRAGDRRGEHSTPPERAYRQVHGENGLGAAVSAHPRPQPEPQQALSGRSAPGSRAHRLLRLDPLVNLGYKPDDEREIERRVSQACGAYRRRPSSCSARSAARRRSRPRRRGAPWPSPGTPVGLFVALDAEGDAPFALWRAGLPAVVFFWLLLASPAARSLGGWKTWRCTHRCRARTYWR